MNQHNVNISARSKRVEPLNSLDDFPTPPWATRALMKHVLSDQACSGMEVIEPACGRGHMSETLKEYVLKVHSSDIFNYGYGGVADFLHEDYTVKSDWLITNPPFKHAEEFIQKGLTLADVGVAVLVRTVFIESVGRYKRLFSKRPPSLIAQFSERVPIVKGRLDRTVSSATGYAWLIWNKKSQKSSRVVWIPPCRSVLELDSDYKRLPHS